MTKKERKLPRLPTGIRGLDDVLSGGFVRGGVYIVRGNPGAGKTILASQACFHHVKQGGKALFVTLLSESHARMFENLGVLDFYDESVMPDSLVFVSAFTELESSGLRGLVEVVRRELRVRRCTLLVLDGLLAAQERAGTDTEFKKFVHELQNHAVLTGTTSLLLTSGTSSQVRPEETMVDGILELSDQLGEGNSSRFLHLSKFRGSAHLRGRHSFRISHAGLHVFPRLESKYGKPSRVPRVLGPCSTGDAGLDRLLGGGVTNGTTTLLLGPPGAGKTTFGLQFLAESSAQEPGLMFGFYEPPERVLLKSELLELGLAGIQEAGHLDIVWRPPTESIIDELGAEILDLVERRKVRRLVIDGMDGFIQSGASPTRLLHFLTALMNELHARAVTTLVTAEGTEPLGVPTEIPMAGLSAVVQNLLQLRLMEVDGKLHRLISVTKMRESAFEERVREFTIGKGGLRLGRSGTTARQLLNQAGKAGAGGRTPRRRG
jgi:circadian clock protein KaiC